MLELLLIRPAARIGTIPVHPAEPPFWVHFPDRHLCGRPGLRLGKANCSYKFHISRCSAALGAASPRRNQSLCLNMIGLNASHLISQIISCQETFYVRTPRTL
jgi:hypothetical protein